MSVHRTALQRAQRDHGFDGLPRNGGYALEIPIVVQHRQVCALGNRSEHEISSANRAMLAAIGQEEHDLRSTVEVGLMRRHDRQRLDQLVMHPSGVSSAEQGSELEDAASCNPALSLQVEELARDSWIGESSVDAVVQEVGQSPHAWLSTSSFVSSIPPS